MKKFTCFISLILSLTGCANLVEEQIPASSGETSAEIFGITLPEDAIDPQHLNVYIDESTALELERFTSEDGLVRLPEVKSIDGTGILRMRRLFPYAGKFEARTRKEGLHRWYEVFYDASVSVTKAAQGWAGMPGVLCVELNPRIHIVGDSIPVEVEPNATRSAASTKLPFNDPRLPSQWHYYNNGAAASAVSGCDVNVVPVWKRYTTGSPDVIVGVVDGGIDFNHEDLAPNMWHNPEKTGDMKYGYNFTNDSFVIHPDNHGTHVAGTIAAVNNNGIGVAGIAGGNAAAGLKGVQVMSLQIFDGEASGSGAQAIKWSADHGAIISQNSWGYEGETTTPKSLQSAVDYFIKYAGLDENGAQVGPMAGGIVIFAAGNEDTNTSGNGYEPIFNVASVGADYRRAYYSNYGDWVDIAAPGGDARKGNQILSTLPGNRYGLYQGTSMACPHVSGVAALIVSRLGGPGFTPEELSRRMRESATPITSFNRNYSLGAGLINAYRAIAGSGGVAPETPGAFSVNARSNRLHFSLRVPKDADDGIPSSIKVYYHTKDFSEVSPELMFAQFYLEDESDGDLYEATVDGLEFNTRYYVAAAAEDLAGNRSALTGRIAVTTGSNNVPVIEELGETSLSIRPHQRGSLSFRVYDPDGHFYSIDLDNVVPGVVLDTLVRDMPKVVINGPDTPSGTYEASLRVVDIYGAAATKKMSFTVLENHPPYLAAQFEDQILAKGSTTQEISCSDYFRDDDGEDLSFQIDISDRTVVNLAFQNGIFYLTPLNYGYSDITVTASDIRGEKAVQSFRVLVRDASQEVDVYPNPVHNNLYVRTGVDTQVQLRIVAPSGATFYEDTVSVSPFDPAIIDMSKAGAGVYTVALSIGKNQLTYNVVKL